MYRKPIISVSVVILIFVLALSALGLVGAQDDAHPFLGVGIEPNQAGALVDQIMPDSPAASAGLQVGDIITAVNGSDVTAETLASTIQALHVGDNVTLNVLRDGETLDLQAALAARPQEMTTSPVVTAQPYLGITLEDSDNGVVIREVAPQSPAADAGLQADDVIVSINGTAVTTREEAVSAIQALKAGDKATLEIKRGDETLTIEATLANRFEANLGNIPGMLNLGITYNANTQQWEINKLSEDSPLYTAGLREGDKITAFDGKALDPAALADYLKDMSADQDVKLTVDRNDESTEITVTADALKSLDEFQMGMGQFFGGNGAPFDLPFAMGGMGQLGVQFQVLDAQIAADKNLSVTDGALVTEVTAGSPAEIAGLQVNDVITAVDGDKVDAEHTLRDRLFAYEPGDIIKLDVLRNGESMSVEATLAQPEMSSDRLPFNLEQLMPFFGPNGGFQFQQPQPPATAPAAPNI
jgi:S1-C subfamily serine protease